jgi:hypothetical protein
LLLGSCLAVIGLIVTLVLSNLFQTIVEGDIQALVRASLGQFMALLPVLVTLASLCLLLLCLIMISVDLMAGLLRYMLPGAVVVMLAGSIFLFSAFGRLILATTTAVEENQILGGVVDVETSAPSELSYMLLKTAEDRQPADRSSPRSKSIFIDHSPAMASTIYGSAESLVPLKTKISVLSGGKPSSAPASTYDVIAASSSLSSASAPPLVANSTDSAWAAAPVRTVDIKLFDSGPGTGPRTTNESTTLVPAVPRERTGILRAHRTDLVIDDDGQVEEIDCSSVSTAETEMLLSHIQSEEADGATKDKGEIYPSTQTNPTHDEVDPPLQRRAKKRPNRIGERKVLAQVEKVYSNEIAASDCSVEVMTPETARQKHPPLSPLQSILAKLSPVAGDEAVEELLADRMVYSKRSSSSENLFEAPVDDTLGFFDAERGYKSH